MKTFVRTASTGLLVATVIAILPATAGAAIAPTLTLNQGAGTTAGSSPATGFDINLNPKVADSLKELTISFPAGFLVNLGANGGSCLASSAPTPLCQLGAGTINGPSGKPATLYLVAPPTLSDVAGVALAVPGRPTVTGDLSLVSSAGPALSLSFAGIAPGITELAFTLTSPRLPSSCSVAPIVGVQATSWALTSASTSAPLSVTGCNSLPFAPAVAATVTKQPAGATVQVTVTLGAGDAAPSAIALGTPTGVKINKVLSPCFRGALCTVGTVSGVSPLLPPTALSSGMLTLTGTITPGSLLMPISGSLTMTFPQPYQLSIAGPINLTERTLTFLSMPDIPLNSMTFTFTGTPEGPAFTTACEAGTIAASLVPQDGNPPVKVVGPVTNVNSPPPSAKPKASATVTGLAGGTPKLAVRVTHGAGAPDIASLRVGLPSGLSFSHRAVSCASAVAHGCTVKGLSLSGAGLKSARVGGGDLLVVFSHPVARVSLAARGPLLVESAALERKAKRHTAGTPVMHLRITDAKGRATSVNAP